ncbi:MAG: C-GCAxxG-C-C family protein [Candidatus Bathyarchaeia archaeon]
MKERKAAQEKAVKLFSDGFNCAQSVLSATLEHWNCKNELVPKIATAFGAGIGRCGSVCGAVTGAVMAIGARFGTNEPSAEKRLKAYQLAQTFYRKFERKHGSVLCRELIGYNLSVPEELEKAKKSGVFEEKCPLFVKTAVGYLLAITER